MGGRFRELREKFDWGNVLIYFAVFFALIYAVNDITGIVETPNERTIKLEIIERIQDEREQRQNEREQRQNEREAEQNNREDRQDEVAADQGGGGSTGDTSSPSSPTSPPSTEGGDGSTGGGSVGSDPSGGGTPPANPPPANPPPSQPAPSGGPVQDTVGEVLGEVCEVTNPLTGICIR